VDSYGKTSGNDPGIITIYRSSESDINLMMHLAENEKLRQQVVTDIRLNQQLESDLNQMDIKIGLLVKNRITLQVGCNCICLPRFCQFVILFACYVEIAVCNSYSYCDIVIPSPLQWLEVRLLSKLCFLFE